MTKHDPIATFVSAVKEEFQFVITELGFRLCGEVEAKNVDPREAEVRVRYHGVKRVIDVVSSLTSGLAVEVGNTEADLDHCREIVPRSVVDFETFLLARHAPELSFPFPEMKPYKTFAQMYQERLMKYVKVVQPRMAAAVQVMATRFKSHGRELLTADLDQIARAILDQTVRRQP